MTVYIDKDYKCHIDNDGTRKEIDEPFFDGKCEEYIEGFRFVPEGESWTREDGQAFQGEMIAPRKDYAQLTQCQAIYDRMLAQQADMRAALDAIYTGVAE